MPIILGIESTAHTFGVGIVRNGKVLSNIKKTYTTEQGGIIPNDSAKHHQENKHEIYFEALDKSGIKEKDIDAIAFSCGPGLAPCLLEGIEFAKELALKLKKPVVPVNHCIAHLEIGRLTKAKDPVMLYVSGANTQIIAYSSGKYRIFGETLDIGVGNFIDNFARYSGIGFPGGPTIEKLAKEGKKYIELPYNVKGMDIALSGILTNLKQKIEKINILQSQPSKKLPVHLYSQINKHKLIDNSSNKNIAFNCNNKDLLRDNKNNRAESEANYNLGDLCLSMQETVFAMLVECAERALAHTGKKELLLGGGVVCNKRLQEMCSIMCKERGCKLFVPEKDLLTDNAAMIAYLGEIMFNKKIIVRDIKKIDISPRQRTDQVEVRWK
ncbi:MAG: tRNA (adenosine(37)-N6)-threonylcarbamoyltransferase complex transferase subunit TsaD [Nanoarchaeota archaeon]